MNNIIEQEEAKEPFYITLVDNATNDDIKIKVLVVGDVNVGKTSIFTQITQNKFSYQYKPTTGYDFFFVKLKANSKVMKLQIWDTSGNPDYRSTCLNWFRNSELCIVVYSVTDLESFTNVRSWIKELREYNSDAPIVLLGNMIDDEENRVVMKEMGEELMEEFNLELFEEVSAKKGFCEFDNFIYKIGKILYYNLINDIESMGCAMNDSIKLENGKKKENKDDCNC